MNKKSIVISVAFVLVLIFALGAFETAKPQQNDDGIFYYREFEDSLGEKVRLTKKPEKVAVLFSSLAGIGVLINMLTKKRSYDIIKSQKTITITIIKNKI